MFALSVYASYYDLSEKYEYSDLFLMVNDHTEDIQHKQQHHILVYLSFHNMLLYLLPKRQYKQAHAILYYHPVRLYPLQRTPRMFLSLEVLSLDHFSLSLLFHLKLVLYLPYHFQRHLNYYLQNFH